MQPTLKKEGKNTVLKKPFSMRVRQSCVLTLSSTQSTLKRERAEKDQAIPDRDQAIPLWNYVKTTITTDPENAGLGGGDCLPR